MEQIINYRDIPTDKRIDILNALERIGFFPAYGGVRTMQQIMEKSVPGSGPQFYFVFRENELIGYNFLIGDTRACLKNHFRNLQAPLCGVFYPHSVAVARYAALIRIKSPTNWDSQFTKSLFQTRSKKYKAFPWLAISNMDEQKLTVCEEMMKIQIAFFEELGMQKIADHCVRIMEDYRKGIGKQKESDCR